MSALDPQVLAFALVAALVTISPGADTFLVVRNSLRGGRRDGFMTVLGISSGLYFHALLSALGVSAVLAHSATAFFVLKVAGAAYLAWLGLQSLRTGFGRVPPAPQGEVAAAAVPRLRSFREGMLTNLLNPKVIVFYLALLPQFMRPGDPVLAKSILLAGIHFTEGVIWLSLLTIFVARLRGVLGSPGVHRALEGLSGLVFIGFGVKLAAARR